MKKYEKVYAVLVMAADLLLCAWLYLCLPDMPKEAGKVDSVLAYGNVVQNIGMEYRASYPPDENTAGHTCLEIVYAAEEAEMPEHPYIDCILTKEEQDFIYDKCMEHDVEYLLIMAVIQAESGYDAGAVSKTNDYGLMQINVCNHKAGLDYLDFGTNVTEGIKLLSPLLHKYGTPEMALMAYNMGEKGASSLWKKGIYSSDYAQHVMDIYADIVKAQEEKPDEV